VAPGIAGLLVVDGVDVGDLEAAGRVGLDVRVQILPHGGIHLGRGEGWDGAGDGAAVEASAVRAETAGVPGTCRCGGGREGDLMRRRRVVGDKDAGVVGAAVTWRRRRRRAREACGDGAVVVVVGEKEEWADHWGAGSWLVWFAREWRVEWRPPMDPCWTNGLVAGGSARAPACTFWRLRRMDAIWRGLPPAAVDVDLRAAGGARSSAGRSGHRRLGIDQAHG
jgi:hypothetical protein